LKYAPASPALVSTPPFGRLVSFSEHREREKAEMLTSEAARPSVLTSGSRRLERADKRSPKGEAC
jgi:hypothetical protein